VDLGVFFQHPARGNFREFQSLPGSMPFEIEAIDEKLQIVRKFLQPPLLQRG
jgi:hypothetical protein